jgi:hypothetical protein
MSEATFRREVFTVEQPTGLACIVASMGSKIVSFTQPAETLNTFGFDVAVYEYDKSVYLSGEPEQLPALITDMSADFEDLGLAYDKKLYCGASGGSFIGFNLQRRAEGPQIGLYATAGVPMAEVIMHAPIFRILGARKAFARHGYDEARLREAWKDIEMSVDNPPPTDKAISVVLGGLDYFVNYAKARRNLKAWQNAGVPIRIVTKPHLSHSGTVTWFKEHIDTLLKPMLD